MRYEYLLSNVRSTEYEILEKDKEEIIENTLLSFNDTWKQKVKDVKASFKYNSERDAIGIFIDRKGKEQLILEDNGLSEEERAVVNCLYRKLEERLDKIRIPKEKWG